MIYLASPYSHEDPAVRVARFDAVCRAAAELMRQGVMVFSPIAHSHPVGQHGLPGDWTYWQAWDRRMIDACDEVLVLRLDGWQDSKGVAAEVAYAERTGKPVRWL